MWDPCVLPAQLWPSCVPVCSDHAFVAISVTPMFVPRALPQLQTWGLLDPGGVRINLGKKAPSNSGPPLVTGTYIATFCAQRGMLSPELICPSGSHFSKRNSNPDQQSGREADIMLASSTSFLANMPKANFSTQLQLQTRSRQTLGKGRRGSNFCRTITDSESLL